MIPDARIAAELDNVVEETEFEGLGEREKRKVRDSYLQGDRRVLITSDRISAFDCVLGTVPFKGQALNQVAAYWFENTADIVPNHVIDVPDPNVTVVHECEQLPLEFVVRGYITGVTKTSAWYNYRQGVRDFCGRIRPVTGLPIRTGSSLRRAGSSGSSTRSTCDNGLRTRASEGTARFQC